MKNLLILTLIVFTLSLASHANDFGVYLDGRTIVIKVAGQRHVESVHRAVLETVGGWVTNEQRDGTTLRYDDPSGEVSARFSLKQLKTSLEKSLGTVIFSKEDEIEYLCNLRLEGGEDFLKHLTTWLKQLAPLIKGVQQHGEIESYVQHERFYIARAMMDDPSLIVLTDDSLLSAAALNRFFIAKIDAGEADNPTGEEFFRELCRRAPEKDAAFQEACVHWISKTFGLLDNAKVTIQLFKSANQAIYLAMSARTREFFATQIPHLLYVVNFIRDMRETQDANFGPLTAHGFYTALIKKVMREAKTGAEERKFLRSEIHHRLNTGQYQQAVLLLKFYFDPTLELDFTLDGPADEVAVNPDDIIAIFRRANEHGLISISRELVQAKSEVRGEDWDKVLTKDQQGIILDELAQVERRIKLQAFEERVNGLNFDLNDDQISGDDANRFATAVLLSEDLALKDDNFYRDSLIRLIATNPFVAYAQLVLRAVDKTLTTAARNRAKYELIKVAERHRRLPACPAYVVKKDGALWRMYANQILKLSNGETCCVAQQNNEFCVISAKDDWVMWSRHFNGQYLGEGMLVGANVIVAARDREVTTIFAVDSEDGEICSKLAFDDKYEMSQLLLSTDGSVLVAISMAKMHVVDISADGAFKLRRVVELTGDQKLFWTAFRNTHYFVGNYIVRTHHSVVIFDLEGNILFSVRIPMGDATSVVDGLVYYTEKNVLVVRDVGQNVELARFNLNDYGATKIVVSDDRNTARVEFYGQRDRPQIVDLTGAQTYRKVLAEGQGLTREEVNARVEEMLGANNAVVLPEQLQAATNVIAAALMFVVAKTNAQGSK